MGDRSNLEKKKEEESKNIDKIIEKLVIEKEKLLNSIQRIDEKIKWRVSQKEELYQITYDEFFKYTIKEEKIKRKRKEENKWVLEYSIDLVKFSQVNSKIFPDCRQDNLYCFIKCLVDSRRLVGGMIEIRTLEGFLHSYMRLTKHKWELDYRTSSLFGNIIGGAFYFLSKAFGGVKYYYDDNKNDLIVNSIISTIIKYNKYSNDDNIYIASSIKHGICLIASDYFREAEITEDMRLDTQYFLYDI